MRCLQCGNQLALLKKFTDGEFCSSEHRNLFFENQQKVIMERLASSALRFKRQKIQLQSNRIPPPVPPAPIEQLPPFAKWMPELVLDLLYVRNPQFAASTPIPAITGANLALNYPPSRLLPKSLSFDMAGPVIEFGFPREWTRPGRSLQISDSATRLRPVYVLTGSGPAARRWAPIAGLGGTHNPLRMRPRGPVLDPSIPAFHKVDVKLAEALVPEPPPIPAISVGRFSVETPCAVTRFFRSRPRGPVGGTLPLAVERIEASHNPAAFLNATFPRMADAKMPDCLPRWLAGSVDAQGPPLGLESIDASVAYSGSAEAQASANGFAFPVSPQAAPGERSLLFLDRAFGEPADKPLDVHGVSLTDSACEDQVESFHSRPIPAAMLADGIGDCAPNLVPRFFPRLCADARIPACAGLTFEKMTLGSPLPFLIAPANAKLPAVPAAECEPRQPARFFKARPRGPVLSGAEEGFAGISSEYSLNLPGKPTIVPAPPYLTAGCAPRPVMRFFKARPRGPISSQGLAEFEQIGAGSPPELLSKPLGGNSSALNDAGCAPGQVVRFFKARPRGPVSSQIEAGLEKIAEGGPAELLSKPLNGTFAASSPFECAPGDLPHLLKVSLPNAVTGGVGEVEAIAESSQPLHSRPATMAMPLGILGECSPAPLVRFFKARPRGPVQFAASAGFEQIETGAPLNLERLTLGTLPAGVIGECSPKPVVQVVHQNTEEPVAADAGDIEKILGASLSLLSRPAIAALPPVGTGACSPNPIVRFFRARPRGPVDAQARPSAGYAGPNMAASGKVQEMPALPRIAPGETAPSSLDRPLQAAPLAGVFGQSLSGDSIDSGFAVAVPATPVLAALPSGIIGELAPAFREKLYRMKPRGAVPSSGLAAFQPIPCGGPEDLCQKGRVPRLLMGDELDFAPSFLNRFYKTRPRGPIQGQSTAFEALQAGQPESLQSRASIPGMPAILMRQARTPSKDRAFRPGPPGPRPNSGSTSLKQNEPGETDTRVSQASMSALPESNSQALIATREALRESHTRVLFARIAQFWNEGRPEFLPCLFQGILPI